MSTSLTLLQTLSDAFGPSGFEDEVRQTLRARVAPLVDEVRVDALGNLIAVRHGRHAHTLMLDAHLDEIGLMVSHIEPDGFLRLAPLGGWDARILPAQTLTLLGRDGGKRRGVVGSLPPHMLDEQARAKTTQLEDLFVDVGATNAAEAAEMGFCVGDPAVPEASFAQLNAHTITGKAFDDRAGCALAVRALEALAETPPWTVAAAFVVREEVGLRGARTAAHQIQPRVALALEGTIAADVPGVPGARQPTRLGRGPAISVADRSFIVPREMVVFLEELARAQGVPFQHKTPLYGGTDAGAIHESRDGVVCGVLSVPCRYIHAPLALMRLADFEHAAKLVAAFVREAPERFSA